jgi:hypothetical protein
VDENFIQRDECVSMVHTTSESDIWARVLRPDEGDLPPEAARFFLNLAFDPADLNRMHELTVRNQAEELSPEEVESLRNFRHVGLQIDMLRSKARLALRCPSP